MIKHIVFFRIKGNAAYTKDIAIQLLKDKLQGLKNKIDAVRSLEAGMNFSDSPAAYDLALVCEFASELDLEAYKSHPDHVSLLQFLNEIKEEVAVVDYKF